MLRNTRSGAYTGLRVSPQFKRYQTASQVRPTVRPSPSPTPAPTPSPPVTTPPVINQPPTTTIPPVQQPTPPYSSPPIQQPSPVAQPVYDVPSVTDDTRNYNTDVPSVIDMVSPGRQRLINAMLVKR